MGGGFRRITDCITPAGHGADEGRVGRVDFDPLAERLDMHAHQVRAAFSGGEIPDSSSRRLGEKVSPGWVIRW